MFGCYETIRAYTADISFQALVFGAKIGSNPTQPKPTHKLSQAMSMSA